MSSTVFKVFLCLFKAEILYSDEDIIYFCDVVFDHISK